MEDRADGGEAVEGEAVEGEADGGPGRRRRAAPAAPASSLAPAARASRSARARRAARRAAVEPGTTRRRVWGVFTLGTVGEGHVTAATDPPRPA